MEKNLIAIVAMVAICLAGFLFGNLKRMRKKGGKKVLVIAVCVAVIMEMFAVIAFAWLVRTGLRPQLVGTDLGKFAVFYAGVAPVLMSSVITLGILSKNSNHLQISGKSSKGKDNIIKFPK